MALTQQEEEKLRALLRSVSATQSIHTLPISSAIYDYAASPRTGSNPNLILDMGHATYSRSLCHIMHEMTESSTTSTVGSTSTDIMGQQVNTLASTGGVRRAISAARLFAQSMVDSLRASVAIDIANSRQYTKNVDDARITAVNRVWDVMARGLNGRDPIVVVIGRTTPAVGESIVDFGYMFKGNTVYFATMNYGDVNHTRVREIITDGSGNAYAARLVNTYPGTWIAVGYRLN